MKLDGILNKPNLTKEDIIYLLELSDFRNTRRLFERADEVRKNYCGDEVHLRGIIEISNFCERECLYCGLRKSNDKIDRFRMNPDEVIETARVIANIGIRSITLQSGEDPEYDTDQISYIIYSIKQFADVIITLSLGDRSFEEYKTWRYAGADRYLLKHGTNIPKAYTLIHQKNFRDRLNDIDFLKSLGYQIGCGNLIGLPMQTMDDIADDLLFCKQMDIDMASFSPFIPSPNTPFRNKPVGSVEITLKAIAIARILLKNCHIPATTSIATIDTLGREKALRVGADVIMPNFTPKAYREKYCIYPNKRFVIDDPISNASYYQHMILSMGRKVSNSMGDSYKPSQHLSNII